MAGAYQKSSVAEKRRRARALDGLVPTQVRCKYCYVRVTFSQRRWHLEQRCLERPPGVLDVEASFDLVEGQLGDASCKCARASRGGAVNYGCPIHGAVARLGGAR